jgi:hypothetical protein
MGISKNNLKKPAADHTKAKPAIGGKQKGPARSLAKKRPGPSMAEVSPNSHAMNSTGKYTARSQKWQLDFATEAAARKASDTLSKLNHDRHFLQIGSDVLLMGLSIQLTWKSLVTGKSLYGYLRDNAPKTMGPGGATRPTNFSPARLAQSPSPASPAIGGAWPRDGDIGYPALPDRFSRVSFDYSNWWDMDLVKRALEEDGFVCLRQFIPQHMVDKAFHQATTNFLGVLKSLTHGFTIDEGLAGLDKLDGLPGKVWERKPSEPEVIHFDPGCLSMQVEPKTYEVKNYSPIDGQACQKGVQLGWVVVEVAIAGKPLTGQPLAAFLQQGSCPKGAKITFQPPWQCYTPLANTQKWGISTSRGFQTKLGMGKCTDAVQFQDLPAVMGTQLWMRNFLASLHNCLPQDLCWQPDGGSFKARPITFQTLA